MRGRVQASYDVPHTRSLRCTPCVSSCARMSTTRRLTSYCIECRVDVCVDATPVTRVQCLTHVFSAIREDDSTLVHVDRVVLWGCTTRHVGVCSYNNGDVVHNVHIRAGRNIASHTAENETAFKRSGHRNPFTRDGIRAYTITEIRRRHLRDGARRNHENRKHSYFSYGWYSDRCTQRRALYVVQVETKTLIFLHATP